MKFGQGLLSLCVENASEHRETEDCQTADGVEGSVAFTISPTNTTVLGDLSLSAGLTTLLTLLLL